MTSTTPGDARTDQQSADDPASIRIGVAWKELRRGASMSALREPLFGYGDDALDPGQYDTLELLVQQPAWRMSELADALRVDPSTATRAVQRLLRTGLAERGPSQDDGRVVMVSASSVGRQRYAAISCSRQHTLASVLAPFNAEERLQLADLLDRMVQSLDRVAGFYGRSTPS